MSDVRQQTAKLQQAAYARGDRSAWHDEAYQEMGQDAPWVELTPNPYLVAWVEAQPAGALEDKRVLIVGCGYGDDADFLARQGSIVKAFDISPTAIAEARKRFPARVSFEQTDLFNPPTDWRASFDFVFEAYTLQVLPEDLQPEAMRRIASFVAPAGTLLIATRGREPHEQARGFHTPLTKKGLKIFTQAGLREISFQDFMDQETPPIRRLVVEYQREMEP